MKLSEINKSGVYIVTNLNEPDNKYLVLISGNNHFLKIESVWDLYHNCIVYDDLMDEFLDWNELKVVENMK